MSAQIESLISQYAGAAGVPPEVAIAVARIESGANQYNSNGSLVTGSSGEIGIFQLMPATAARLGVDPADVGQNIQGGVAYLQQLYAQFGNWNAAVAAYNAGPGRVASGSIPTSTQGYVSKVMSIVSALAGGAGLTDSGGLFDTSAGLTSSTGPPVAAIALGVLGLLVVWWLVD